MITVDELRNQREKLVEARASGTSRISIQSPVTRREVEYRSVDEIEKAIAAIDREIAGLTARRPNTFLPTFSKGL